MDPKARSEQSEAPTSSAVGSACLPGPRSCPRDTALRHKCVAKTIWMVYVTEPSQDLYKLLDSGGRVQRCLMAAQDKPCP